MGPGTADQMPASAMTEPLTIELHHHKVRTGDSLLEAGLASDSDDILCVHAASSDYQNAGQKGSSGPCGGHCEACREEKTGGAVCRAGLQSRAGHWMSVAQRSSSRRTRHGRRSACTAKSMTEAESPWSYKEARRGLSCEMPQGSVLVVG